MFVPPDLNSIIDRRHHKSEFFQKNTSVLLINSALTILTKLEKDKLDRCEDFK